MNYISDSVRGLSFILRLYSDRLLVIAAICVALAAATYVSHP